mgnify:CR=1 FL=1
MHKLKVKKGDKVLVISGKDKGKSGEIVTVFPKNNRVMLRGLNIAKKHTAQSQTSQGGILDKELSIHVSNAMYLNGNKPTKIGIKRIQDGNKTRFSKSTNKDID